MRVRGIIRRSLLWKMLFIVGGSTLLIFSVVFGVLYWEVRGETEKNAVLIVEELAGNFAGEMRLEIERPLAVAQALANAFEGLWNEGVRDRTAYSALLKGVLEDHPSYLGVWTVWEPDALDGKDASFKNTSGYDATGRFLPYWYRSEGVLAYDVLVDYENYYGASKTRESVIEPFPYEIEGKTVLLSSITAPIVSPEGKFLGVAGVDIALSTFGENILKVQPYQGSRAFLFANGGTMVATSDPAMSAKLKEGTSQTLKDLSGGRVWEKALREGRGFSEMLEKKEGLGDENLLVMVPMNLGNTGTPWGLMIFSPVEEVLRGARKLGLIMLFSGILGILLIAGVLVMSARFIVRPIRYLANHYFPRLAKLDFATHQEDRWLDGYVDEIGRMVSASRNMREEVGSMVRLVQEKTVSFAQSAESLSALSQEGMAAMEEIRGQIEQVAQLSENNSAALEETNAGVEEVSGSAASSAKAATEGAEAAEHTRELSARAVEAMDGVTEDIGRVGETSRSVTNSMKLVNTSVESIAGLVNTITGIADQTNLLALNAAIEAARAGEAGRGFAVVAEEVRKLAEESNRAAREVEKIIASLQEGAKKAVTDMNHTDSIITAMVERSRRTQGELKEALEGIYRLNEVIHNIAASAQEQAASSEEMSTSVDSATKATVDVVTAMENIRSATGETSRSSESVAEEAQEMNRGVLELQELLRRFVVDTEKARGALSGKN